ncbi:hypothetical protein [Frankia sp. R82]|uniref:hypothetical protein n=1 Tax=Frankia sp. R82 TaxID=2950553 RepID=UPI002042EA54|nr:hypothetical protein [Frankia sp. R82]MCM3884163.1 hypothetical protein [Frankia sp. R82]
MPIAMPRTPTVTISRGGSRSAIYIEPELARAADPELDRLIRAEEKLGRKRNLRQGQDRKVDELYRQMHARHAEVQNLLAREVIVGLVGQVDGDKAHLAMIAQGAVFDRHACDGHCSCSPAVMVPGLLRGGRTVTVLVK